MPGAVPRAKVARVQVTTPATWPQVQPAPEALTKLRPAGIVSVTLTPVACEGPRFSTLSA